MNTVILACLFFSLLLPSEILAQQHIEFNHLTVEDGLSQSSVTCILQDRKGFMWFGTQDGLNRYDGYKFKIFKNDPSDSTSLTDNFIFSIYENPSGELYIETQSGTLHHYNPRSESFLIVNKDSVDLINAKVSTVGAMLQESSGITWTGGLGSGTGLKRTDTNTGHTTVFKHDPEDPSDLSDEKVYSVFRDRSGNLWVATFNGLDRLDELTGEFFHYRNDPDDPTSLTSNSIQSLLEDRSGIIWIGTFSSGLNAFDPKTGKFTHYTHNPSDSSTLTDNRIYSLAEDKYDNIWIGTYAGGLNKLDKKTGKISNYQHHENDSASISSNATWTVAQDESGKLWIGTFGGGFNVFNPDSLKDNIYPPPIDFTGYKNKLMNKEAK